MSGLGGGLTKTGGGTFTLNGVNTYTGATTIAAGTLALTGGSSIASSSVVTVNGGATFDVSGSSVTFNQITTLAGGGTVQLGGNGLVIDNGSTEFSGTIADGGNCRQPGRRWRHADLVGDQHLYRPHASRSRRHPGAEGSRLDRNVGRRHVQPGWAGPGRHVRHFPDDHGCLRRRPVRYRPGRRRQPGLEDAHPHRHHRRLFLRRCHPGWRDRRRHRRIAGPRRQRGARPGRRQYLYRLDDDDGRRDAHPVGQRQHRPVERREPRRRRRHVRYFGRQRQPDDPGPQRRRRVDGGAGRHGADPGHGQFDDLRRRDRRRRLQWRQRRFADQDRHGHAHAHRRQHLHRRHDDQCRPDKLRGAEQFRHRHGDAEWRRVAVGGRHHHGYLPTAGAGRGRRHLRHRRQHRHLRDRPEWEPAASPSRATAS